MSYARTDELLLRPTDKDYGYAVERCDEAIRACNALATTRGERDYWERVAKWWEAQREFAKKR